MCRPQSKEALHTTSIHGCSAGSFEAVSLTEKAPFELPAASDREQSYNCEHLLYKWLKLPPSFNTLTKGS